MSGKEWVSDVRTNVLARDTETGELVLVTNGICIFNHTKSEYFRASHADNGGLCCYTPHEGLVFEMDGKTVKGWGMADITARKLEKAPDDLDASVKRQMHAILDADKKKRKRRV